MITIKHLQIILSILNYGLQGINMLDFPFYEPTTHMWQFNSCNTFSQSLTHLSPTKIHWNTSHTKVHDLNSTNVSTWYYTISNLSLPILKTLVLVVEKWNTSHTLAQGVGQRRNKVLVRPSTHSTLPIRLL